MSKSNYRDITNTRYNELVSRTKTLKYQLQRIDKGLKPHAQYKDLSKEQIQKLISEGGKHIARCDRKGHINENWMTLHRETLRILKKIPQLGRRKRKEEPTPEDASGNQKLQWANDGLLKKQAFKTAETAFLENPGLYWIFRTLTFDNHHIKLGSKKKNKLIKHVLDTLHR